MTDELAAHDLYTHRDGHICVLGEDGIWWVPYDVGGEGDTCERQHGPPSAERDRDERAAGWDRAHTMLCSTAGYCREHRNPYQRSRAGG